MKNNLAKKIIFLLFFISFNIFYNSAFAITIEETPCSQSYQEWLEQPQEIKDNTIAPPKYTIDIQSNNLENVRFANIRLRGLNSEFDLRDNIKIKVKNQGETMECWACSATTVLETNAKLTQNINNIEYSSRHMNYSTSNIFTDGVNEKGHNRDVKIGGNSYMATAYLASGRGPILEGDMPFVNSTEKISLSEIENKQVQIKLEETINFPTIHKTKQSDGTIKYTNGQDRVYTETEITSFRNNIKQHIMQYGGVMAYMYAKGEQYYSNQDNYILSKAYNCDEIQFADHAVTIIGWDDNYAITNFNEEHRPTKPGAYIIQNSYGTEIEDIQGNKHMVFDNGCLYISYEDFLIEQQLWGIVKTNDINYDTIYQYDELGYNTAIRLSNDNNIAYAANVFTRDNIKEEKLNEISIMTISGCSYEIYVNSLDGELSEEKLIKVKTVPTINKNGYYTVKLDNPIILNGSKFAVAIKVIADNVAYIPIEAKVINNNLWNTATSKAGESFIGDNLGNWADLKNMTIVGMSEINVCIKAFTTQLESSDITISSSIYKFDNTNCIYNILPYTTVDELKNNISSNDSNYKIKTEDRILANTELIGTNIKLALSNGIQYTLIVTGDVNGDGKISVTDVLKIKKKIVSLEELDIPYKRAGDINNSNDITTTDLVKVKKVLVGIDKF